MGFIWECLYFDWYSRMSSPSIPDGGLLLFDVTVTWSSPWDNALYVRVSARRLVRVSILIWWPQEGWERPVRSSHLSSARVGLFPNVAVKYLVKSHFKWLKWWSPKTSLGRLFCSLITLTVSFLYVSNIQSLTQWGYKELSLFKVALHLGMIS